MHFTQCVLVFFLDNFNNDCVLQTLFLSMIEATKMFQSSLKAMSLFDWVFLLPCYAIVYSLSLCLSVLLPCLANKRVHTTLID